MSTWRTSDATGAGAGVVADGAADAAQIGNARAKASEKGSIRRIDISPSLLKAHDSGPF
jgi:hypothetical protein